MPGALPMFCTSAQPNAASARAVSSREPKRSRSSRQCGLIGWTTIQENSRMIDWNIRADQQGTCIAIRYTWGMTMEITTEEYRALAELRCRIRRFLRDGDAVAQDAGLEPQQYLLLLTIRGLPAGEEATIRTLAERLALKHHSVVELIDRLETHGYVRRTRGREDRRRVLVSLLLRGQRLLEQVGAGMTWVLRRSRGLIAENIKELLPRGPRVAHQKPFSKPG